MHQLARKFGIEGERCSYPLERLELGLMKIGFVQADFAELTLPELYLRYCLAVTDG